MKPTLFAWLLALTGNAAAQDAGVNVILSDEYGRPMTVGTPDEATAGPTPMALSGEQIATEFNRLCIADAFQADEAAHLMPWQLAPADAVFPATKKTAEIRVRQLRGPSARVSYWDGPAGDAALKGQPVTIRDRGVVITSGYGSFKANGRQCNLDLSLSGFSDVQGLADALTRLVGQPATKLVIKPGFADGYWRTPVNDGTRQIAFTAVDLKKPTQRAHLTVQIFPAKAAK